MQSRGRGLTCTLAGLLALTTAACPWLLVGPLVKGGGGQEGGPVAVPSGFVVHPTHSVALTAPVRDLAFDGKRNVLYLSQPDSLRVAVLSLGTYSYTPPIAMPSVPAGLDLTPGGDSLLVGLRRAAALGVIDLTQPSAAVGRIPLSFDTSLGRGPDALRVASNGKAIISLTFDGIGFGGAVLDYDLAMRTGHARTDVGIGGVVSGTTFLARSADRTTLLLLIYDTCCPVEGQAYSARADAFSPQHGTAGATYPPVAVDAAGDRFLIGGTVFTSTFANVATVLPQLSGVLGPWPPATLSPDGSAVYVGTTYGYDKMRVRDGALLERVQLSQPPTRLTALPDGHTLIAEAAPLPFSPRTSFLFVVSIP